MMTYIKSLDIHIKEHIVHIYLFDHIYILALSYGCARFNLGRFFAKTEIEPKYSVFIEPKTETVRFLAIRFFGLLPVAVRFSGYFGF